jgi:hypothetical protein
MPLILIAFAFLFLGVMPALATASLTCEAEDKSIAFSVQAALGGVRHGQVVNFGGSLEVKARGVPADLRKLELGPDDRQQSWIDDKQFKLEIYRERGEVPNAYVLLTLDTRKVGENSYRGRYALETDVADKDNTFGSKPRRVHGNASCSVD